MILVFDTETTGLVIQGQPPEHPAQPHLVQLGALLLTDTYREVASCSLVVRPEGYHIPEGAARAHGITTGIAKEVGIPLANVVGVFAQLRALALELVAFNIAFDRVIMETAFHRLGRKPSHPGPGQQTCAMELMTPVCNLPPTPKMTAAGFTKNKPPNLTEAYRHFFAAKNAEGGFLRNDLLYPFLRGEDGSFIGAHDALNDCRATVEIMRELRRKTDKEAPF